MLITRAGGVPVVTLGLGVVALGETTGTDALFAAVPVTVGLVLILVGKPAAHWISSRIPAGVIGSRPS
ncbi:hypothetical protein [Pseudodonghicola flavimaris]|uniref:Uncharacterized protein n=1 Tax=Pseudodonghicola flavimaris TaxID=3050036 RepID=A0ABT7F5C5_9RHOB|nr:hypothetical protein [Pseudodonghicola flavimaris]MDK3019802.1 hypothetical protein [Pseudodonghicola flavimaris]